MDQEFYFRKRHVPAFGSWDCENNNDDDLPFTECFESARGLFRYSYSEDLDLYVAGDLYDNHVLTPAMIVVPRHGNKGTFADDDYVKTQDVAAAAWVVCDSSPPPPPSRTAKAVDEDLYKISPDLLRAHSKKKRSWCFFSSCLQPTCVR